MFGKLLNHTTDGQTVTLHYEKQTAYLHVLTDTIINVFVPFHTKEHLSKAIEGGKEQPVSFTLQQDQESLVLSTPALSCRIHDDFKLDFHDKDGNLLCADYRGRRIPRFTLQESLV